VVRFNPWFFVEFFAAIASRCRKVSCAPLRSIVLFLFAAGFSPALASGGLSLKSNSCAELFAKKYSETIVGEAEVVSRNDINSLALEFATEREGEGTGFRELTPANQPGGDPEIVHRYATKYHRRNMRVLTHGGGVKGLAIDHEKFTVISVSRELYAMLENLPAVLRHERNHAKTGELSRQARAGLRDRPSFWSDIWIIGKQVTQQTGYKTQFRIDEMTSTYAEAVEYGQLAQASARRGEVIATTQFMGAEAEELGNAFAFSVNALKALVSASDILKLPEEERPSPKTRILYDVSVRGGLLVTDVRVPGIAEPVTLRLLLNPNAINKIRGVLDFLVVEQLDFAVKKTLINLKMIMARTSSWEKRRALAIAKAVLNARALSTEVSTP
jgi:hypothetical protein